MAEGEKIQKVRKGGFKPGLFLALIVLAIVEIGGLSCFYIVDETENAVITRFGKYQETVGAGLHFKLPFGIDKSYTVPVKVVQTEQFGFKTVKSGRNNEYINNKYYQNFLLTSQENRKLLQEKIRNKDMRKELKYE